MYKVIFEIRNIQWINNETFSELEATNIASVHIYFLWDMFNKCRIWPICILSKKTLFEIYDRRPENNQDRLCVDEQIVPFNGKINIKKYAKNKPKTSGLKIFVLAELSGIIFFGTKIYRPQKDWFLPLEGASLFRTL